MLRFVLSKGATEARTWLYFFDGVSRLRRVLVSFRRSFPSIVGVGHSIAFDSQTERGKKVYFLIRVSAGFQEIILIDSGYTNEQRSQTNLFLCTFWLLICFCDFFAICVEYIHMGWIDRTIWIIHKNPNTIKDRR